MNSQDAPIVFVTGGTGFLGHALIPALVKAGYRVRALTRTPHQHTWLTDLGVEIVAGDVTDPTPVRQGIQGARYVVHAAAKFAFWGKREQFERTNVQGAANVMDAALQACVEKFVHVSTIVVVGKPLKGRVVDETHPTHPEEPYQMSKLRGEQLALEHFRNHGLPVVILRPGAFYGPHSRYAFNRLFIEDALKGIRIKVDGGHYLTFPVYIHDVAAGIIAALERGRAGEIYNLCGDPLTHNEANQIVSEESGISTFRLNVPGWSMILLARLMTWISELTQQEPYYSLNLRSYVFNNWTVSSEKARRELGFAPISFREGVKQTLAWYRMSGVIRVPRQSGIVQNDPRLTKRG
ncbi:MAG: NAD-dependent epimerase/dehydratase family protein [Anaerolineae bacterium]